MLYVFRNVIFFSICLASSFSFSKEPVEIECLENLSSLFSLDLEEKKTAKELMHLVSNHEIEFFLENQEILQSAREQFSSSNPLRLVGFMKSDPEIAQIIGSISPDDLRIHFLFLWLNLLFNEQKEKKEFLPYFEKLIEFLKIDPSKAEQYREQQDFVGFLKYVFFIA